MPTVMIIDDQVTGRMILGELVRSISDDVDVVSFTDPVAALDWAKHTPPDLVLTDYKMPHMDGVQFTQWFRKQPGCAHVPLVMITGIEDRAIRYKALEVGATDFLAKPIDHYECQARCRNLLTLRQQQSIIHDRAHWLEREISKTTLELKAREKETLLRLAKAGEYRDLETGNHVLRMAAYCRIIAEQMDCAPEFCDAIEQAAPMHDIGKIGIPDRVLLKPGPLTDAEWETMRQHTVIGHDILQNSPSEYLQMGATIALRHHERYDGSGYPSGLAGDEIPLEAAIVAVADIFDALLSPRPYKQSWSLDGTLEVLRAERGKQLHPECVDAFLDRLDVVLEARASLSDKENRANG